MHSRIVPLGLDPVYLPRLEKLDPVWERIREESAKEFVPDGALIAMDCVSGRKLADIISNLNEGVAEYTGVRVGLPTAAERTAYALRDLEFFVQAPTFVRSFAYATGPAWGLLLDQANPAWRDQLAAAMKNGNPRSLDQMLQTALRLPEPAADTVKAREADYDTTLRPRELARDQAKQAHLAQLKARLVDGPVLRLPLAGHHASYQFNPQTLEAFGSTGVVYPTMKLSADWGALSVEQGALLDKAMSVAAVTAAGASVDHLQGPGWRLSLNQGWVVAPGERAGDFVVRQEGAKP